MKYDMIIFDIDGTIWDVSDKLEESLNESLKYHGYDMKVSTANVRKGIGYSLRDYANLVYDFIDNEDERIKLVKDADLFRNKIISEKGSNTYPGFIETFKDLSKKYKTGIVSNCGANTIETLVDVLGIDNYVTDYIAASKLNITKADAIKKIAKDNNAKNYIYIGDTALDKESSELAGADFIHAAYGFGKVESKYKIDSLNELPNVISKMETI